MLVQSLKDKIVEVLKCENDTCEIVINEQEIKETKNFDHLVNTFINIGKNAGFPHVRKIINDRYMLLDFWK